MALPQHPHQTPSLKAHIATWGLIWPAMLPLQLCLFAAADVTNSQGLLDALTTATGAGKEGVIVKDETAPYILNDRSDWVSSAPKRAQRQSLLRFVFPRICSLP